MLQMIDEYPWNAASPTNQPGCFICGTPKRTAGPESRHDNGEYLIDLGVSTDEVQELDGTTHSSKKAVVCEACVRQLADMIGCLGPEEAARLLQANQTMNARLEDYDNQAADWEALRGQLSRMKV